MTTLAVGPRIVAEAASPRRWRVRVMLIALAISLLVHAAVAAVLLWPAAGPRDAAGEGAALVVEIVGAAPQAAADTPATATPPAMQNANPAEVSPVETVIEPPAAQPVVVEASIVRPEPEPVVGPALEIAHVAELAAIEPTAGPPLESEPELAEPEIPTATLAALALLTLTAKPALAAARAAPVTTRPVAIPSVQLVEASASSVLGQAVETAASTTSEAPPRVANAEPGAAPAVAGPGVDRAPLFDLPGLDNPWPDYPRLARRRGQEGEALLAVTVLADGAPVAVELRTSSGYALLDEAALDAVRRWRFAPALVAGQPVQAVVDVPVVFRLE